jgi:hypothetical protein
LFSQTWQAIGSPTRPSSGRDHLPGGCFRGSASDADAAWLASGDVAYLSADVDDGLGDGLGVPCWLRSPFLIALVAL